jgi:hypothetical protein
MNSEERIEELEKSYMDQAKQLVAMDMLLKSLIIASPDRKLLRHSLEVLSEGFAEQAREYGFSTGRKPRIPRALVEGVQAHVAKWIELMPTDD